MSNGKVMIIHVIVGVIKKILFIKKSYFPPYTHSKNKIEFALGLSNYAKKMWLKKHNRC